MSLRNHLVLPIILSTIAALAGCGSSNPTPVPPPGGGFSNSNLNGTYVFSITGGDSNFDFMTTAGTLTADGKGNITGGTLDINDSGFSGPLTNNPITAGSYNVTADGRGTATLATSTPFGSTIKVDFVLATSSHGLITQFDGNATGSGTLDLQANVSQAALAGTFVFGLSGISGVNQVTGGTIPAAAAGVVTLDSSGAATGSMDFNNNSTPSQFLINSGSSVLVGTTPGTATIATSSGTLNFDVYPISTTHLKIIESDSFPILAGDVYVQTSATFPSNTVAFTMAGIDYASQGVPMVIGGLIASDGTTISGGEEDFDDGGATDTTPVTIGGTITPSGGRSLLQLTGLVNGNGGAPGTFTFAAYPSSGGIQLVEIDGGGVTSGVAYAQTSTSLAANQGYGFNLTAVNSTGEEDDIAEFSTASSSITGIVDFNDQGIGPTAGQKLTGTYTADSPASGRGVITSNSFDGAYYVVDSQTALFMQADTTQLGIGSIQLQSASAQSNLTKSHLAMLRLKPTAKGAWKKKIKTK